MPVPKPRLPYWLKRKLLPRSLRFSRVAPSPLDQSCQGLWFGSLPLSSQARGQRSVRRLCSGARGNRKGLVFPRPCEGFRSHSGEILGPVNRDVLAVLASGGGSCFLQNEAKILHLSVPK